MSNAGPSNSVHTQTQQHDGTLSAVRDELLGLKDTVRSGVQDTTEGGRRVVQAAKTAAVKTVSSLGDTVVQARDSVGQTISDRPFTAIAIAAGVGALLGAGLMWRRR